MSLRYLLSDNPFYKHSETPPMSIPHHYFLHIAHFFAILLSLLFCHGTGVQYMAASGDSLDSEGIILGLCDSPFLADSSGSTL